MGKIIPFALAGVGSAATSVGGVYLIKGTTKPSNDKREPAATLAFESLRKFKEGKGGECTGDLFGTAVSFDEGSITAMSSFDGVGFDAANQTHKGCLIINYQKKGEDAKWTGIFTWSWSFVNGSKGMVVFGAAKTKTSSPKEMALEGGFYLLEKDGNAWKVKQKKEVEASANKKIEATGTNTLDNHFPKPAAGLDKADQTYWGFISGADELNKICPDGDSCKSDPIKTYRGKWNWAPLSSGGTHKPHEWSAGTEWFKNIYGDTSQKLKEKLTSFGGKWTHQGQEPKTS